MTNANFLAAIENWKRESVLECERVRKEREEEKEAKPIRIGRSELTVNGREKIETALQ